MKKPNLLSRIWNFLFPDNKEEKQMIIAIVNGIKNAVESKEASWLVNATTFTDLDDKALTWLKRTLPFILKQMALSDTSTNLNESVQEAVSFLRIVKKKERTPIWQKLSGKLYASRTGIQEEVAIVEINQEYTLTA